VPRQSPIPCAAHGPSGWSGRCPDELTDEVLAARLYASSRVQIKGARTLPDWPTMHRVSRRKGVTLNLLRQEHQAVHPDGHGYSQFCDL
jgi:transposase